MLISTKDNGELISLHSFIQLFLILRTEYQVLLGEQKSKWTETEPFSL